MEKWLVATKKADFNAWGQALGVDPVVARILRNRDVTDLEEARKFLYGTVEDMHSPHDMLDMDKAVEALLAAMDRGDRIRVIGDYDVDGVTSTYILKTGLGLLGADVDTAIPHRIHDGYGLSDQLVRDAAEDGIGCIITCDNGISAASQIRLAYELGMRVIVTDHHEVPYELGEDGSRREILPEAEAVVDPKRAGDPYPFPSICGAMVAYKLMQAMEERTGNAALQEKMSELLEFAAIGTVCDVMELKDENRIAVREGLSLIRNTQNPGLRALMEVSGIKPDSLSTYHIGFVIGPSINATGRLDCATRALELFCVKDRARAVTIATELKELNDSRKNLTQEGIDKAEAYIREQGLMDRPVWVIFLPEVHESIAGIIAGKIKERYHHPVFLLTRAEDGVKGSGRSIETYHMYDHMVRVKDFFTKFGGHAMAAGLSMREEDIPALSDALCRDAELTEEDFVPVVHIDVPMPMDYATMKLAEQLEILEPCGTGNPRPLFAQKDVTFIGMTRFGSEKQYARYQVKTAENRRFTLVSFGNPDEFLKYFGEKYSEEEKNFFESGRGNAKFNICFRVSINRFRGETKLDFQLENYV